MLGYVMLRLVVLVLSG